MLILLSHNYDLSSLFKYYYCGSLSYFTRKKNHWKKSLSESSLQSKFTYVELIRKQLLKGGKTKGKIYLREAIFNSLWYFL